MGPAGGSALATVELGRTCWYLCIHFQLFFGGGSSSLPLFTFVYFEGPPLVPPFLSSLNNVFLSSISRLSFDSFAPSQAPGCVCTRGLVCTSSRAFRCLPLCKIGVDVGVSLCLGLHTELGKEGCAGSGLSRRPDGHGASAGTAEVLPWKLPAWPLSAPENVPASIPREAARPP